MAAIDQIKKLREETNISIAECKKALEGADNDLEKAREILRKQGMEFAAKKRERGVVAGIIESYVHSNKKVGVLLALWCETDFVAKNNGFQELAHELCLQIASMDPQDVKSLLGQPFIKDPTKTIQDLVSEYIARLGENIIVEKFIRYEI
jgi:elongation factor Ts